MGPAGSLRSTVWMILPVSGSTSAMRLSLARLTATMSVRGAAVGLWLAATCVARGDADGDGVGGGADGASVGRGWLNAPSLSATSGCGTACCATALTAAPVCGTSVG